MPKKAARCPLRTLLEQALNIRWPEAFWPVASRLVTLLYIFFVLVLRNCAKKKTKKQKKRLPAACYLDRVKMDANINKHK